jgi:uncharacterized membrane protein YbhN (UPF0104 family)
MEEAAVKQESKLNRVLKLLLKIAVTILCFWYISKKIDFATAKKAFFQANWSWLLLAVLLLMVSKLFSAFRLNIYFRNIRIHLPEWKNIKLYWLGMFYNLFLPGSISGDAYKVVLLKRKYNAPYKKTSAAVLLDRFSGLVALGLIMSIYGIVVFENTLYDTILICGAVAAVVVLYLVIRFFFTDFLVGFWATFVWGFFVQAIQVACIYCILLSLRLPINQPQWVFIFLIAAVVAVFPISLGGGLGTRELMFVEGAKYFHLDAQIALVISLLFYLSTVIASLWGVFFVLYDPLKDEK